MKRVLVTVALVLSGLVFAAQAQAATYTVGTTADTGGCAQPPSGTTCTLRQLVTSAPGGSTIDVPAGVYQLTAGELLIDQNLTIAGAGAFTTEVEQTTSTGNARVFDIQPDPASGIAPTVTISGLDIFFGKAVKGTVNGMNGGNVLNNGGTLTLSEDQITNGETIGGEGAGVANVSGTLTITHSLIEDNLSFASGGIGGSVGGLDNIAARDKSAQLTIDNSTIVSNTAQAGGGGVSTECQACGSSTVTITNATIFNNDGGTATTNAGGLVAGANSTGGTNSTISIKNSIVSGNTVGGGTTASNCAVTALGAINSGGHNIETATDCGFKQSGDHQNTNPDFLTGAVSDYGGNSDTIALAATGPAVDAIPTSAAGCTKTHDQRDIARPQGGSCDIGAYELIQPVEGAQFSEIVGRIDNTSATIDWGDGTPQSRGSVNTKEDNQVTGTHTYAEAGTYHGILHWINTDGRPSQSPFDVKVTDAPLSATGGSISAVAGSSFSGQVATLTDGDPLSTASDFAASIDWGDGTKSTGTIATNPAGGFVVNGMHAYSNAGSFMTSITINDVEGSSAGASGTATVNPPRPTVTSLSPTAGPTSGGTSVKIIGANLAGATAVKFGSNAGTITSDTATQIVAVAPAGSAGAHDVTVTTPGGTSETSSSDRFTFVPPPTIIGITPSSGPAAGGTSVTITGTDFTGASSVHFGAAPAAGFTFDSATQITANSPAGAGIADVTVTTPSGTSATSPAGSFTYNASSITPPPTSPTVLTGAPSVHGSSGAALEGSVNPQGLPTTAHYEYGLDSSFRSAGPIYDQSTTSQNVGSDFSNHTVVASLSGLVPNALYHVRLVATNSAGTTFGPDATFTTKADPPPPPPKLAGSFNVQRVNGIVLIEIHGKFVPLTEVRQIPTGAIINALHGTLVLITSTGGSGTANVSHAARSKQKKPKVQAKTQKGTFGGAVFKVTQDHSGLATLSLVEGASFPGAPSFASCKTHTGKAAVAALSKRTLQLLRGKDNHGKFRTKGRYAAATVRGTAWTIADRCDGTLTHVVRGTVAVSDFVRHKTVVLRAGHSYLATARK